MNFRRYPVVIEERGRRRRPSGSLNPRRQGIEAVHHPLQLNWVNTGSYGVAAAVVLVDSPNVCVP